MRGSAALKLNGGNQPEYREFAHGFLFNQFSQIQIGGQAAVRTIVSRDHLT